MKSNIFRIVARQRHIHTVSTALLGVVLAVFVMPGQLTAQNLQHRYSFIGDASDSVGTANGSVVTGSGQNPTFANGVTLYGGGNGGYLTLPGGILNTTTNVTVEFWASQSAANNWSEVWSFNSGTPDYWAFISDGLNNNNNLEQALRINNNETDSQSGTGMSGGETHYTVTFNASTLVDTIWQGTSVIASSTVPNSSYTPGAQHFTTSYIGVDPWNDPQWQGTIYEFRIYNGALTPYEVAINDAAGPATLPSYTPSSVTLVPGTNMVLTGTQTPTVDATSTETGAIVLNANADATNWVSSNPSVLTVNSSGFVTAVGVGTATISATVYGVTGTSPAIFVTAPQLLHRYSFVSDASDSVGSANGTLVAPNGGTAATISNGLMLPGNRNGGYGYSGYVNLPNGILTNTTSLTVETWVTQNQGNSWAELWDFGINNQQNFGLIPYPQNNGDNMEVAFNPNNDESDLQSAVSFPNGSEQYVAMTYNNGTLTANLYTNGVLVAATTLPNSTYCPGTIGGAGGTTENNLGNDVFGDWQFDGTVYEFRIWNGAVSPVYLAAAAVAGPTIVLTNLTPQSLSISLSTTSMIGAGTQQATVSGSFVQVSGVPLTTAATNWVSSNPAVLTVNSSGLITAQSGGMATVSATVAGVTATSAIITVQNTSPTFTQKPVNITSAVNDTVTFTAAALGGGLNYQWEFGGNPISGATSASLTLSNLSLTNAGTYTIVVSNGLGSTNASASLTVNQAILQHRYSFVSDASDSVGGANGAIVAPNGGSAATISGGLSLPGNTHGGFGYSGYVSLPNGILTNTTSITIETWVTQNSQNNWATIWDFADNGNINFELCPFNNAGRSGGNLFTSFDPNNNENDIDTSVVFPNASETYVTLTVNAASLVGNLYTNGVLVGTVTLPNSSYLPHNIGGQFGTIQDMLGNDTYGDNQFSGTINEFRIWDGAVTPFYTAVAAAAGPSTVVTSLTPTAVSISVATAMQQGQTQQAAALVNFPQVSGVSLTGFATNWISSNPAVLTVNSNGVITAVSSTGSATISGTVAGVTGTSASITVANSMPAFNQTPPTNLTLAVNNTLTLVAPATGGGLTYVWKFNGNTISGATSGILSITNIGFTNAGTYQVLVSNNLGSTNTSTVLTVVQAILEHRYSFVSDASDSVGGPAWNGTPIAPNGGTAVTFANGLTLPGGGGGGHSGYVAFPSGILTNTASLTIECWVTQNTANQWATIWDFANNGSQNFEMCPFPQRGILNLDVAVEPNGGEIDDITSFLFPSGQEIDTTYIFNAGTLTGGIYTNGILQAAETYPNATYIPGTIGGAAGTSQNWLGNDTYGDAQFQGTIYEFRIWDGQVTPLYLAASAAAGPSIVVTNLTPSVVNVTVTNYTMIQGQSQPGTVVVNLPQISGVLGSAFATNWISSNTGVVTVNSNGVVTAVGTGSATISATVNGVTGTSASISVPSSPPIITQQPPASDTFLQGATLTASVVNIGTPPFVYRWYLNGGSTPISTSASPTLTIPNIQPAGAGNYTVLVSNLDGTILSSNLNVTVLSPSTYEQTVLQYNPVAYWPLQETSGSIAYDVVGGDNGIYTNTSINGSSVNLGQSGPSQSFFGNSSLAAGFFSAIVDIPEGNLNITGPITITAWVQEETTANFGDIIGHGDSSWRTSLTQNGDAGAGLAGGNDGSAQSDATAPTSNNINDDNWHMVAYTYSGNIHQANNGALYVDGVLEANNTIAVTPPGDNLDIWIGGAPDYGTARLLPAANIAHVAIFNQAFTAAQVQGLYNATYVLGPQTIKIADSGTNVVLTWQVGTLLQSTNLLGPWTTNSAATSPYMTRATNKASFFRLLVSP